MGLLDNMMSRVMGQVKKQQADTTRPGHTHNKNSQTKQGSQVKTMGAAPSPGGALGIAIDEKPGGRPEMQNNFISNDSQKLGAQLFEGQQMVEQRNQIKNMRSNPVPLPGSKDENLSNYGSNFTSPMNQGFGKYKKGDLMDESDQEESMFKSTNSPNKPISGKRYNVENVSDIQVDKKGQFMTTLGDNEYYGMKKRPTSSRVTNYDQGKNAVRDTLRPIKGKKFKKLY